MSPAAYVAVGAVRVYQWTVRPLIGANCRFYPSCSEYAVEAFREHGALRGGALAGWRILRCNPWCTCGYDPVPPRLECSGPVAQEEKQENLPLPLWDWAAKRTKVGAMGRGDAPDIGMERTTPPPFLGPLRGPGPHGEGEQSVRPHAPQPAGTTGGNDYGKSY